MFCKSQVVKSKSRKVLAGQSDATTPVFTTVDDVLLSFPLRSILGARLLAVRHTLAIKHTANDVIPDAGEVANTATAHEHDGVFLQVVAFAGDVGSDLDAVRKPNAGHLAECRIWLLGRHRLDDGADTTLLRTPLHGWVLRLRALRLPRPLDQLINRRHS